MKELLNEITRFALDRCGNEATRTGQFFANGVRILDFTVRDLSPEQKATVEAWLADGGATGLTQVPDVYVDDNGVVPDPNAPLSGAKEPS